jgi:hypothetical protein
MNPRASLLVPIVILVAVVANAAAAGPSLRERVIGGSYVVQGENLDFGVNISVDKVPSGGFEAQMDAMIMDSRQGASKVLGFEGKVPLSVLKLTGRSISINIPDIRDLVGPDFELIRTYGYSGPIPLKFTITKNNSEKMEYRRLITRRIPQEDGSLLRVRDKSRSTYFSAFVEGVLADYKLPIAEQYSAANFGGGVEIDSRLADGPDPLRAKLGLSRSQDFNARKRVTGASYLWEDGQIYFTVAMTVAKGGNGEVEASLRVDLDDWWSKGVFKDLVASGRVPLSVIKIGRNISIDIPDLRTLDGPDFVLHETGLAGPIPLKCTITNSNSYEFTYSNLNTYRLPQADGKLIVERTAHKSTNFAAAGQCILADYNMSASDPLPEGAVAEGEIYERENLCHKCAR